jgi:ribosome hibernation promoting factor
MKVFVQSVNFNADKELIKFVEEKVGLLDKFYDKIINAEVFLKVQKTSEKSNKIAEIKVSVPGDDMMVKKQSKYMEEAVNLALDTLKRQLKRKKEKLRI